MKLVAGSMLQNAALVIYYVSAWNNIRQSIEGDLAQLAWSCFEAMPPITNKEAYNFDELAGALAKMDMKRGFNLLKRALEYPPKKLTPEDYLQPDLKQPWNPLSLDGQHVFWNTLRGPDHQFALRFVLQIGLNKPKLRYRIESGLLCVISQDEDADILVALARENQKQAELICHCITTFEKPNFYKIAFGILECYPNNEKIEDALVFSFGQLEGGYFQEWRQKLEKQLKKIEAIRDDPHISPEVKSWVGKLEPGLRRELEFLGDREY